MVKSKDAYYEKKDNLFIIGTEKTEKVLELTADGSFYAKSVKNKITGKEYVCNVPIASDEFFIQIDKKYYSGGTPGWNFASAKTQILSQEELEVVIVLINHVVEVKRHYVIYPGQPVIQEWNLIQEYYRQKRYQLTNPLFLSGEFWVKNLMISISPI